MKDLKPTCRIAVVQAVPVLFDKTACTDKAVRLIAECARSGAELIVYLLFTLYVVSYMVSINFSMLNLKRFPYSPKEKYAKYKFKNTVFCA